MAETEFQNQNTTPQLPAQSGAEASDVINEADRRITSSENTEKASITIPAIVQIEQFLNKHYRFRKNIVVSRVEFKPFNAADFTLLDEYKLNSIYRKIKIEKISTTISELRSIINSDFIKEYDPFVTYFDGLPKWDGISDHISQLASLVDTANNDLFQKTFKKWLIASVACSYDPKVTNHTVLVLSGVQGVGKSSYLLNLIPDSLKRYVFSGSLNPKSKDSLVQLSECLLINLDELDSLNCNQIADTKALITLSGIKIRRAYGYYVENLTRRASFCGSVNDKEFLHDQSGNRRFLCHDVKAIDYKTKVQLDLVYSQAFSLYRSGFKYWFDGEDIDEITAHNEQFQSVPFEEELLLSHFEPVAKEDATLFLSTTDIASNLAEHRKFNITASTKLNLGRALHKHQFVRVKKKGRYVFAVKTKSLSASIQLATAAQEPNN